VKRIQYAVTEGQASEDKLCLKADHSNLWGRLPVFITEEGELSESSGLMI
jgi:hypothetical protein